MSYKKHYARFRRGLGGALHFAAHSHHLWPDATRRAALECWDDAALGADRKWEKIFAEVVPTAAREVAQVLGWPSSRWIAFAPNAHELAARLLSCRTSDRPLRILTTGSEFHSFARQAARLEEDGARVTRVPVEPIETLAARLSAEAAVDYDMIYVSQVFFDSGLRLRDEELELIAAAARPNTLVVFDGYHAFMAVPLNLKRLSRRAFYIGGGYKYAQAGEGACFLAVPPGCDLRPRDTGWYADFDGLEKNARAPVGYASDGRRFWGATFDPTGLYRWNAVCAWRRAIGLSVRRSDAHVRALQKYFLARLGRQSLGGLTKAQLVSADLSRVGHFLTFRTPSAASIGAEFARRGVIVDWRGDRLRIGFGLYHDPADIDALFGRLKRSSEGDIKNPG